MPSSNFSEVCSTPVNIFPLNPGIVEDKWYVLVCFNFRTSGLMLNMLIANEFE